MLLRRLARPLLASWFVTEGLDAARRPGAHVAFARPAVDGLLAKTTGIPRPSDGQLRTIIQAHGAATALAGLALATGKAPRTAALVLAVLTLPIAAASLPGGKTADAALTPELRRERRDRFVRSLAFTGAALLTGVDTEGRPGVSWRLAKARQVASARTGAAASGAVEHAKAVVSH
ncbi:DoxX family protein [Pengzhenrongella sicca]|uniref:DoxX family protein n=1 Tax=Pengzhenrongella sicca TaxID=2819238 RepID=A0A8A4ZIE5_9MICO|nr:DoxX family protein [Pengzhenrongella sicca]QTE30297.1 DoxX family protein [Pengzhenrongella sicca]